MRWSGLRRSWPRLAPVPRFVSQRGARSVREETAGCGGHGAGDGERAPASRWTATGTPRGRPWSRPGAGSQPPCPMLHPGVEPGHDRPAQRLLDRRGALHVHRHVPGAAAVAEQEQPRRHRRMPLPVAKPRRWPSPAAAVSDIVYGRQCAASPSRVTTKARTAGWRSSSLPRWTAKGRGPSTPGVTRRPSRTCGMRAAQLARMKPLGDEGGVDGAGEQARGPGASSGRRAPGLLHISDHATGAAPRHAASLAACPLPRYMAATPVPQRDRRWRARRPRACVPWLLGRRRAMATWWRSIREPLAGMFAARAQGGDCSLRRACHRLQHRLPPGPPGLDRRGAAARAAPADRRDDLARRRADHLGGHDGRDLAVLQPVLA